MSRAEMAEIWGCHERKNGCLKGVSRRNFWSKKKKATEQGTISGAMKNGRDGVFQM